MTSEKGARVATAAGFLGGMLLCLDALRDVKILWPPPALWEALQGPKHLELAGGITLIVVTLIIASWRHLSG